MRALPQRAWTVVFALALLAMVVTCFVHPNKLGDYIGFLGFGRAANDGVMVYDIEVEARYLQDHGTHWATWPPGFAPLAALLAYGDAISHLGTLFLFRLLNMAAALVVLFTALEWTTGRHPFARDAARRLAWNDPVVVAALLVPIRVVLNNCEHSQVNLLVLALVFLGLRLLGTKTWLGALLFGVGSAMKATPLVLLPWLVWRRRGRDLAIACVGVVVGWLALPALFLGGGLFAWWQGWFATLHMSGQQDHWMNQSLRSIAVINLGHDAGVVIWLAGAAAVALWLARSFGRPFAPVGRRRAAVEAAVLMVASTIVSPVSWKAHYVSLVPLAATVLALAQDLPADRRRLVHRALVAFALLLNLTSSDVIGRTASVFLQQYGLVLWLALGLIAVTLRLLPPLDDAGAQHAAGTALPRPAAGYLGAGSTGAGRASRG